MQGCYHLAKVIPFRCAHSCQTWRSKGHKCKGWAIYRSMIYRSDIWQFWGTCSVCSCSCEFCKSLWLCFCYCPFLLLVKLLVKLTAIAGWMDGWIRTLVRNSYVLLIMYLPAPFLDWAEKIKQKWIIGILKNTSQSD